MKSPLDPQHYGSTQSFASEQERVFRRHWIFAGFTSLLEAPDAYLSRTIGGVPVVIQNTGGSLRAFENTCAHRHLPLQWGFSGRRPLTCRYHGWSYDASGRASIPAQDALYQFDPSELERARLGEFALARVGAFLFVNLSKAPLALEDQFEPAFLHTLRDVSGSFDTEFIHTSVRARFDWKLGFENVIDPNHVRYVHARSFARNVAPPAGVESIPATARLQDLSWHQSGPFSEFKRAEWHARVVALDEPPRYQNWFVWPNVNFVSVGGYSFSMHQFNPASPGETEILMILFLARKRAPFDFSPAVLWHNIQSEKRILDEDIEVLERLQAGLHAGLRPALLGAHEGRLERFRRWHQRTMA